MTATPPPDAAQRYFEEADRQEKAEAKRRFEAAYEELARLYGDREAYRLVRNNFLAKIIAPGFRGRPRRSINPELDNRLLSAYDDHGTIAAAVRAVDSRSHKQTALRQRLRRLLTKRRKLSAVVW